MFEVMFDNVELEKDDRIARIWIDRSEKRNAMDVETREELREAFEDAAHDDDVRCIVMESSNGVFSSGGDLETYSKMGPAEALQFQIDHGQGLYGYVEQIRKPTIAAIDGFALGGGTEISLAFDFRLATPRSKMGTTEMNVGLYPGGGSVPRLTNMVGIAKTKELVLLGKVIDAEEAEELGLVHEVYEDDEFDEQVEELAQELADKPPLTYQLAKDSIFRASNLEPGYSYDRPATGFLFGTEDQKEGAEAFLEDREPEFEGK
jgi:enoyl-CoA hydratase